MLRLTLLFPMLFAAAITQAQVNLSNGLVAHFPFNGDFNDASGHGNHAVSVNGAGLGTDKWGNLNAAASFDGIDDYLSVAAAPSISPTTQFSIAFRFKTASPALQMLFSKSNYYGNGAPDNFQYQIGINGQAYLVSDALYLCTNHISSCTTNNFYGSDYTFGNNTEPNQWICVTMTFDNGVKKIYMNGSLVNQSVVAGTNSNNSIDACSGGTFRIGTWWEKDHAYYKGLIDEVRLYNRPLNAQEAEALCDIGNPSDNGPVGISNISVSSDRLVIAPNPATDQLSITVPKACSGQAPLRIFNAMGQLVASVVAVTGTNNVDVSRLSAGVYYVQLLAAPIRATGTFTITR